MTLADFVKKRRYLVWYVKNPDRLSEEAITEAVLNEGDWDDVQTLLRLVGKKKTAQIFKKQSRRSRCNYRPEIKHFFTLYFKKHA